MHYSLLLPAILFATYRADISQADLEALSTRIAGQVEELRGDEFIRPVAVSIADNAGFIKYAKERMEMSTTEGQVWADEMVMKMLGILDPKLDYMKTQMELLESQVGGFYDPQTESFCLMSQFDGGLAKIILAHELTHALDDQLFDIDGMLEKLDGNADAQLAFHAVVEGSGTATMGEWLIKHMGEEVDMKDIAENSDMGAAGLADAPAAIWKPLMMVYMRGAAFLKRSDNVMTGQMPTTTIAREDLEKAFTNPPRSTEQILHPEKYWDPKKIDEPIPVDIDTTAAEADGWQLITKQNLGEAVLALATSSTGDRGGLDATNVAALMGVRYTNRAAEGWGGDRYVILKKGEQIYFRMATVWDTEKDAEQFYENLDDQNDALSTAHRTIVDPEAGRAIVTAKLSMTGAAVTYEVLLSGGIDVLNTLRAQIK